MKYLETPKKRGRPRKDEVTPKDWLEKIERAKKVKSKWKEEFRVQLADAYYEGRNCPPGYSTQDWISLNMIWATIRAQLPGLYSADPYYYVNLAKSYTPNPLEIARMEQAGFIRQSMLNYLKKEVRLKPKSRLSILDAFFAYGLAKIHTTADLMDNPNAGQAVMVDGVPLVGEDGQEFLEPEQLPANVAYQVTRIDSDDHLVDEDAGPLDEDVSWHAQRVRRPVKEVQADKKYAKAARDKIKATELSGDDKDKEQQKKGGLASSRSGEREADLCVLWEVYDLRRGEWLTVAEGLQDEFLREPGPLPRGVERHPFVDLRFSLRRKSWYPIPPVAVLLDSQREYGETRSYQMRHRKNISARKYELDGSAFDNPEDAASRLETGDDGTVIIKSRPTPGPSVSLIQDAPLDQQIHVELSYLKGDFFELSGAGSNQRGTGQGIDSATEAGLIEKHAMMREGDDRETVKEFLTDIARKLDQQVQANITRDQAVRVTGPQGEYWEQIRQTDYQEIDGEYEYSIDVGLTMPQLPEIDRAQALQFFSLLTSPGGILLGLAPNTLKKLAAMFHLTDQVMIQELQGLAQKVASGQLQVGNQGSAPAIASPATETGGAAMGMANMRTGAA